VSQIDNAAPAVPTRRGEILAAALAAFCEQGVAATSIDEIRRRSGASVGSIYHRFPGGKDAIAAAVYLDGLRDYQNGFVEVLQHAPTTRGGVEAAVQHHLAWITDNADLARFILLGRDPSTTALAEEPLRQLNRRFFGAVRAWMTPRVAAGELFDLPAEVVTALWIGPSQELARHWLTGRSRISPAGAAPKLAAAAWRSLSAPQDQELKS
jgi:AcrR family transcriptional regulator